MVKSLLFLLLVNSAVAKPDSVESLDVSLKIEYGIGLSTVYYQDYKTVRELAGLLNEHSHTKVFVSGHTDSVGTYEVNQKLSDSRAENIKKLLVKFDVSEERVFTKGMGESSPIASNKDRYGRAKNRRSSVRILGLQPNEIQKFKEAIKRSNLMALIDSKGQLSNSKKFFDKFYETQTPDLEPQKKSYFVESESNEVQHDSTESETENKIETGAGKESKQDDFKSAIDSSLKQGKNTVFGFLLPNWSSKYYESDTRFQHGKFNFLGFGLGIRRDFSNKWYVKAHAQYLPTSIKEGESEIDFSSTNSLSYENNIYGIYGGYVFNPKSKSKLSFELSLNSHIIGGLEQLSLLDYTFEKYNHIGLGLGVNYDMILPKKWTLYSGIHYLVPLSVSNVEAYKARLWYRGVLGLSKELTNRIKLHTDYQIVYHDSQFEFASGISSQSEFSIQTLSFGIGYKF